MEKIKVEKLSEEQIKNLGIPDSAQYSGPWSVWECESSTFDWHYDQLEKAYIYEGKVRVKTAHEEVEINAGDFVTFPKDLDCSWNVIEKIKKVYKFE